ncbi:MAG: protein kinase domain-containing protein, partial [Nannocystaceae bacterium]
MERGPPEQFGRYRLVRLLGEGGMAEVYLATVGVLQGLQKHVVIKKIRGDFAGDPDFTRMFVDEAKIALSLNHANLVQVFDFGDVRGQLFLAMEWVEGIDLMQLMRRLAAADTRMPAVIAAY